jgi:hypothetical protein
MTKPKPAPTVAAYLKALPADRRAALSTVRDAINAKLPDGYEEAVQYGMISWRVPESVLPAKDVYNKQPLVLASLGAQKNHMAVYLMCVYADAKERAWFEKAYKATGKKLDMGKSCLRFTSLDTLAVDVVAEAMSRVPVERFVAAYRKTKAATSKPARSGKPAASTKPRRRAAS